MPIGWIDFSSEERNKVMQALKSLETPGAIDELGLGVTRDRFANLMFPGISTVQTRAKYYITLPKMLLDLSKDKRIATGKQLFDALKDEEDKLAEILRQTNEPGIIGQDGAVKNKPSAIFFGGLRILDIVRNKNISLMQLCSLLIKNKQENSAISLKVGEEESDDLQAAFSGNRQLLSVYGGDIRMDTLELSRGEAEYLYEKIATGEETRSTLLKDLIDYGRGGGEIPDDFFAIPIDKMTERSQQIYVRAKAFSDFTYGAYIRYNILYARTQNSKFAIGKYESDYSEWERGFDLNTFSLIDTLSIIDAQGYRRVLDFLTDFDRLAKEKRYNELDVLIANREKRTKGTRAKINLNDWQSRPEIAFNAVHAYKLTYRYYRVHRIARDIVEGLDK